MSWAETARLTTLRIGMESFRDHSLVVKPSLHLYHCPYTCLPLRKLCPPPSNTPALTANLHAILHEACLFALLHNSVVRDAPPHDAIAREEHFADAFGAVGTAGRREAQQAQERAQAETREVQREGGVEPCEWKGRDN